MKYIIVTTISSETVLVSYLYRIYSALIKRKGEQVKLYILESEIKDLRAFASFCSGTVFSKKNLSIHKANVPVLEKLSLGEYCSLLFDSEAEPLTEGDKNILADMQKKNLTCLLVKQI